MTTQEQIQAIDKACIKHSLSTSEIANRIGVSTTTWWRWVNDFHGPRTLPIIQAIHRTYQQLKQEGYIP